MKKLLALLLCFTIVLPHAAVGVSAEENYTYYKVNIDAGSGAISEKAIIKDGEIYIPAESFENYTRFAFDEKTKTCLIKGQTLKKAFKSVIINVSQKTVLVDVSNLYDLSNCFEVQGEIYLPLCQMLPILNADIYEVKDNVIYIANNPLSLAEVLYDFDIADYYFNLATEFNDMSWAAALAIVPNYVLDTVVGVRFDRLDIVFGSGEYNDYKDAFSDFLSDDNLYLKAMAKEPNKLNAVVDFFVETNKTAKEMKTVYDWVEEAGKSKISSETGGVLLDALKDCYKSGDLDTDDLKKLNDAWNEKVFVDKTLSFGECVELVEYIYTYATLVEDNRQMLDAVYSVQGKISKKENDRRAAQRIYELYGEEIAPALTSEIVRKVSYKTLEKLSPIGIYTATAEVAGTALKLVMPFDFEGVASLPTYSDIVLTASSKYFSYDTQTDESTENLRLSLLLCLIASKKCFETLNDVKSDTYYKNKIEKIDRLIMGLYMAAENTRFDSFEHFEEYRKNNLAKVNGIKATQITKEELANGFFGSDVLAQFIGKTVGDVKAKYGTKYTYSGFSGSTIAEWNGLDATFFLDGFYEKPSDNNKIDSVLSFGEPYVLKGINGKMTYPQIVSVVGEKGVLQKPEHWYNEMDGVWTYTAYFTYSGYKFGAEWAKDPNKNYSIYVAVYNPNNKTATSSTPEATSSKPASSKPATSSNKPVADDAKALEKQITEYLKKTYFYERDMTVLSVSIYNNGTDILTQDYKTDNEWALIGVDYYKKTRTIKLYDTGELKFVDTLPK